MIDKFNNGIKEDNEDENIKFRLQNLEVNYTNIIQSIKDIKKEIKNISITLNEFAFSRSMLINRISRLENKI